MIKISIAGLTVLVKNRFGYIERLSSDYITDGEPDFEVEATPEEIERERGLNPEGFSDGYLESVVIHRNIAERLPLFGAVVFHAATVMIDGKAYAFTAKSGTGKTTHTRHIISRLGERARYINGDKPIVRIIDGVPYAYGTPWRGKESYGENISAPLVGVAYLSRAEESSASVVPSGELATATIGAVYIPKNAEAARGTLAVVSELLARITTVKLGCSIDPSSAEVTLRAFGIE